MTTDRKAAAPVAVRNRAPAATRRPDPEVPRQERRDSSPAWAVPHRDRPVKAVRCPVVCPRAARTVSRRDPRCRRRAGSRHADRYRRRNSSDPRIRMPPANFPRPTAR